MSEKVRRLLEDEGDTLDNMPADVRLYASCDGDAVLLVQGGDRVVVGVDDWPRFCREVESLMRAVQEGTA